MANQRTLMNEAHPEYLGWQADWPLYVKAPMLTIKGKVFKKGDYFPWAEMQVEGKRVAQMYRQKLVYHNANFAKADGHGDRLGEMTTQKLRSVVGLLNNELKKNHCATEEEFKKKRCRQSVNAETQRRFIRQFLSKNPYMNDYFMSIRDDFITKVVEKEDKQDELELQSEQSGD
jgi:hypothetical protein